MAQIVKCKRKNDYCYSATVRRKDYPSTIRTFDTKGEALAWATELEQKMRDLHYQSPNITKSITFNQIMAKYLTTITTQITEKISQKDSSKLSVPTLHFVKSPQSLLHVIEMRG